MQVRNLPKNLTDAAALQPDRSRPDSSVSQTCLVNGRKPQGDQFDRLKSLWPRQTAFERKFLQQRLAGSVFEYHESVIAVLHKFEAPRDEGAFDGWQRRGDLSNRGPTFSVFRRTASHEMNANRVIGGDVNGTIGTIEWPAGMLAMHTILVKSKRAGLVFLQHLQLVLADPFLLPQPIQDGS